MFATMADFKQANADRGEFWFSENTMRFFQTEIESDLINLDGRQFFVTSEEDPSGLRLCTIREALADGTVETIGGFHEYDDLDEAVEALHALVPG